MQNHGFIALGKSPAEVENITAMYVKADLTTTGTPAVYDTDSAVIVNKLISGINDAKNIIARRKYRLYYTEDIALDTDACFEPADLTYMLYKISSISYNGAEIDYLYEDGTISCDAPASETVSVKYAYIPDDMLKLKNLVSADTDAAYVFPDIVDYRILCYRAAQLYYEIQGSASNRQKAKTWESKFSESLNSIPTKVESTQQVKDVYNIHI
jgi:hypothetical protein